MSKHTELIAEVTALFDGGWCICHSSTLPERVLEALKAAETPTPSVPMSLFIFRRAVCDPTGYYFTDWNKAIPVEVLAESEVMARAQGFELSGAAPRGRAWLLRLDKVAAVTA